MGYLTSPSKCCCQICANCCNGTPTEFDVTLTLADSECDLCEDIGGTYNFASLNTQCGGFYSNYSYPGVQCTTVNYITRKVYYRELRFSIWCQEPYWLLSVRFKIWMERFDPSFGIYYLINEFWWWKQIDATGIECVDVCEDLPLLQKWTSTPIGGTPEWICDPGALGNTTSCNLCAVP